MPAVKLCDCSSCRRRMFSFVREVAQVVPAATSKIHRRNMRTRLYIYRRHQQEGYEPLATAKNSKEEALSYYDIDMIFFTADEVH